MRHRQPCSAELEPYRPLFLIAAGVALVLAYRRLFRRVAVCEDGAVCAVPHVRATYKALFWTVVVLVVAAIGFPVVVPLFY